MYEKNPHGVLLQHGAVVCWASAITATTVKPAPYSMATLGLSTCKFHHCSTDMSSDPCGTNPGNTDYYMTTDVNAHGRQECKKV